MEDNIICSGALFYSTSTNVSCSCRGLTVDQRNVGTGWRQDEVHRIGLRRSKREIKEEVGAIPKFKKVIPLEMFTSNDEKFSSTLILLR